MSQVSPWDFTFEKCSLSVTQSLPHNHGSAFTGFEGFSQSREDSLFAVIPEAYTKMHPICLADKTGFPRGKMEA